MFEKLSNTNCYFYFANESNFFLIIHKTFSTFNASVAQKQ